MEVPSPASNSTPRPSLDYWTESTRPLTSLVFISPMLLVYELGLLFPQRAVRNGADAWMREWLDMLGFGQYFLLPLLTCGILLGWHHLTQQRWKVPGHVVGGMWLESFFLGLVLLVIAHGQAAWFATPELSQVCQMARTEPPGLAASMIGYLGAGIYEELLFRLMLLPLLVAGLRACGLSRRGSLAAAILASSCLFSLAHYRLDFWLLHWHFVTTQGHGFEWFSFLFRVSAGLFFALLFVYRGFGIAAGAHAIYDILAVVL